MSSSTAVDDLEDVPASQIDGTPPPKAAGPIARIRSHPVRRWMADHPVMTAAAIALVVRLALSLGIYLVNGGALFGDETTYTGIAWSRAEGSTTWWDDFISRLYWGTSTFTVPLTWLFELWGRPITLAGQLLATVYATVAAAFTAAIARRLVRPGLALAAGLTVALLPSQVLFSVLVLKDSGAWFTLAGLGYVALRIAKARDGELVAWIGAAAVLLFLLGHVRDHTTVVASWALLGASVLPSVQRIRRVVLVAVVVVLVPIQCGIGPIGISLIQNHGDLDERRANNAEGANTAFVPDATAGELAEATEVRVEVEEAAAAAAASSAELSAEALAALEAAQREAEAAAREESRLHQATLMQREATRLAALAAEAEAAAKAAEAAAAQARLDEQRALERAQRSPASNLEDLFGDGGATTSSSLSAFPIGLRVMVLDPLPWQSTSNFRVNLAKIETVFWYPLLALAAIGLVAGRRRLSVLAFPILAGGGIFVMYALSEGNFGTAFRHRGETVWAVGVLAAVGAEALLRRRAGEPVALPAA